MDEAEEHQNRANQLLGFSINLKEPERKKRKYKRKVLSIVEENAKKYKGGQGADAIGDQEGGLALE
ncbi:hypothetical protein MKX03_030225, partial [Papaver bracteatum]